MRLDQELVARGLCESRSEAQELIETGAVLVNAEVCSKQTKKVLEGDDIRVTARRRFVSRGGEKLMGVLHDVIGGDDQVHDFVSGKTALDVGSSTGGFSDCLLSYDIKHIDAVDVGTSQLHAKLRGEPRISLFENTDIRVFTSKRTYEIIVCDVSFISLTSILDVLVSFGKKGTQYFLLIKPQFEVGNGNTKKGIVKDEQLVQAVLDESVVQALKYNLLKVRVFPCHLVGGDGNQEYFLYGILK